ncbi:right-handed parallel beta-helix repeat-containing protein [Candidatus Bipolaricaulota bacterium]|nr:right-handed parallel beta-helix repeat-containing protein [Candidatus Bipolaricaulota bacterium]
MKCVSVALLLVLLVVSACAARELVVTSTEDSGVRTLRWALQTARSGDTITFDPAVFPPESSASIRVTSVLPSLMQGDLTIDASDAGVILDGQGSTEANTWGLEIISDGNVVRGLQIINFTGFGIQIVGGAQHNVIGGDRDTGAGPTGQGNLSSGNSGGIGLYDEGTSYNTITGNLIGTDITGTEPFGNIDGIFVSGGASHNTIGPGNIIAHNHERAIVVQGSDSLGNTITQNSIHDNGWGGIQLLEEANHGLSSPFISSFDVTSGLVTGTACPNCTIEVFSEEIAWEDHEEAHRLSAEGRQYEGCAETTPAGAFLFDKGSSYVYSHLTATATDTVGNTSEFSMATSGAVRSWGLQLDSGLPMYCVGAPASLSSEFNRIGTMLPLLDSEGREGTDQIIRRMDDMGFMWNKFYIDVPDWNEVGVFEGYSDGKITPAQDCLVDQFVERGWKTVLGLVFWDESANARIPESGRDYSRYETEEEILAYLDHVRSVVRHFKDRIEYYEILNEPNAARGTQQYVAVDDYINLIRRAVAVIRQEDPQAKVVIGAVASASGMGNEGIEYLLSLLNSDVMALVDVVSWHPFNGESPANLDTADYYYGYPAFIAEIRSEAISHGFAGELMGSELLWKTELTEHICPGCGGPQYSPLQAAKYYARGVIAQLGMDILTGVGGVDTVVPIYNVMQNSSRLLSGHEAIDMPVEIDIETEDPVAHCAFRFSNGDRMLAVWTDGIAQDEDPGVFATITLPDLIPGAVTGIDVLHGFEQELVFETAGDSTIIRDLLVKDYPILIRLSGAAFGLDYVETVGDGFHRLGEPVGD